MSRQRKVDDVWSLVGYVRSSQYRDDTVRHIAEHGPSMPSEIAEGTGNELSHVSRSLSELRDREIVELLVPEQTQRGRIYGLSDRGEGVAARHRRPDFEWTLVDVGDFPHAAFLEHVRSVAGSAFNAAAYRDGRDVTLVGAPDGADLHEYEVLIAGPGLGDRRAWGDVEAPEFLLSGFDGCMVVQLPLGDGERIGVGIGREAEIAVPRFVDECVDCL